MIIPQYQWRSGPCPRSLLFEATVIAGMARSFYSSGLLEIEDMPSPAVLFAAILFSTIGFLAFRYGKKDMLWKPMAIGAALMVYPYFVSQTWLLYVIGGALCVGLFIFRE